MIGINKSMKTFLPTYLYVKTHNKTGLKYFGKTTNNPHNYRGSGTYWLAHLKIHGNDVDTEVIGYYTDKEECIAAATLFSTKHNIVEAVNEHNKKVWANQILENGVDGGNTGRTNYSPLSLATKEKMSQSKKGKIPWNKGTKGLCKGNTNKRTKEQKEKISKSLTGRKRSPDAVEKTANKLRGRKRPEITQALTGRKHSLESIAKMKIAQQNKGPLSEETKNKIREARKLQVITKETKEKLKGKVVVIDKTGKLSKMDKEQYYMQTGPKEDWEWVSHKSKEAKLRKK